jgi:hypothetical protein
MPEKLRQVRMFLQSLAGAREEILAQCPSERVKFESLGWSLLITCGMAVVSMWFALSSAMGVNGVIAVFPALLWGLVILGIDRWLITSMPRDGKRKLLVAAPRLLMAVLLGTLISTPFVLRIFQAEINAQIAVIKQQRYSDFIAAQQKSNVGTQVSYWTRQVSSLQKVVDSGGAQPLNPDADPRVQALTKQRGQELSLQGQYYKQWQCQLYGVYQGVKCPKGNGPLAKASENSYNQAKAQVAQLTSDLRKRENQLAANDAASQRTRYDQAKAALPAAQTQLQIAQAREDALRTSFNAQNDALNGILIRLQALSQLSKGDFTVTAARFLVFLLFLVVEILPVTVKLFQPRGPYDEIFEKMQKVELKDASRRGYRPLGAGNQAAPFAAGHPDATVSVRDIWERTKVMPRGFDDPADRQATEPLGGHAFQQHQQQGSGFQAQGAATGASGGYRDAAFQQQGGTFAPTAPASTIPSHSPAPTRRDPDPGVPPAPAGNPARTEGYPAPTRVEAYPGAAPRDLLPPDETRRDLSNLPAPAPGSASPITDSGPIPLAHQGLLDMNDKRSHRDADGQSGGELDWDEN